MDHSGLLIAIESTDATSGATAFLRLRDELTHEGYDVASFEYPQTDQPSGYFVQQYLAGTYGPPDKVGPYNAALIFGMDHFQTAAAIREALAVGKVVIVHKFVGANMAEQGVKFDHPEERRGFFIWLDNAEFQMLGMPRPDRTIVIRTPTNEPTGLLEVYDDLCQLFPKDFTRLDAVRGDKQLDTDMLHKLLRETIQPLLPAIPTVTTESQSSSQDYYIPETLNAEIQPVYRKSMNKLIRMYSQLIKQADTKANPELLLAIQQVLPVATLFNGQAIGHKYIQRNTNRSQEIPGSLSPQIQAIDLVHYTPRNELELVVDILYSQSNLSLRDIVVEVSKWSYEQKSNTVQAALAHLSASDTYLEKVVYSWDLTTSFDTFTRYAEVNNGSARDWQLLTPRYGYEVPDILIDAGLTDQFQECFDLSLELYSQLQSAGHHLEAQYSTLLGHKMRWKIDYNVRETLQLHEIRTSPQGHPGYRKVVQQIHDKLTEVHPIISEALMPTHQEIDTELTKQAAKKYMLLKPNRQDS